MSPIKLGIQSKLFYYFLAIITVTLASGGLIIEEILVYGRMGNIQNDLLRHLRTIELMIKEIPVDVLHEHYPKLAIQLGRVLDMRVTFIDPHGVVVGDSAVNAGQLAHIENHAGRPEVVDAAAHGMGSITRYSSTIGADLFYMAYTVQSGADKVVVRLARSLKDLQDEITQLRQLVALSVLLALLMAAVMSGLASYLATKSLRRLVRQAMQITGSGHKERLVVNSQDEIGGLAASFNAMLGHLEQLMASVTLERDRLKTVLEGILDAVIAVDAYGRITLANHAALTLLGLKVTPIFRYLEEVLPRDQLDGLLPPYLGGVGHKEIELRGRNSRRVVVTSACTASDKGCIILMRDITERHRLQQIQRDFVASASHELRTPVSIIRLNAETLMDGALEDPEVSTGMVEAIFRQSLRLSQLVSDLLDISRLESGSHRLNPGTIQALSVAQRVEESLLPLREGKGIALFNQVDPELVVFADGSAMEQVLTNLVTNALKYTPSGGSVVLDGHKGEGDWVRFQVVDDGPGIPLEHHAFLFNRFYRVDPGRSREMGGTGLGLTIVKHLVEAMGGRVGLEAVLPHGCCFWFTLPTQPPGE